MHSRRIFLRHAAGAAVLLAAAGCGGAPPAGPEDGPAAPGGAGPGATALTEVFGDGLKLTAVALRYDRQIDTARLTPSTFSVAGRTVRTVYAAPGPARAPRGENGPYVIVELSTDDADASLMVQDAAGAGGQGGSPQAGPQGGGGEGGPHFTVATEPNTKPASASVVQTGTVTATDGTTYPASPTAIATTAVSNLIVDDFEQRRFTDPSSGTTLDYNLFVPKGYDGNGSYPLVLFMHDASVLSTVTTTTLTQGLGAVCWASPADQAERPAFVLAPQYSAVVDDGGGAPGLLDATVNLVEALATEFAIDRNRLYTTGQSMGGIASIAMDIKYPDLFAASYLVACQWGDVGQTAPMVDDKLWIVVSEGDAQAYPGQNQLTAALEGGGAKVARAVWDGTSGDAVFAGDVATMIAAGAPINYVALKRGTVVPAGQTDSALNNHLDTWRIAYRIEGVREWIFQQRR